MLDWKTTLLGTLLNARYMLCRMKRKWVTKYYMCYPFRCLTWFSTFTLSSGFQSWHNTACADYCFCHPLKSLVLYSFSISLVSRWLSHHIPNTCHCEEKNATNKNTHSGGCCTGCWPLTSIYNRLNKPVSPTSTLHGNTASLSFLLRCGRSIVHGEINL